MVAHLTPDETTIAALGRRVDYLEAPGFAGADIVAALDAKLTNRPDELREPRSLDTSFVVSAVAPALVSYTLELAAQPPLLSSASALVELQVNGVTRDAARVKVTQLGGLVALGVFEPYHSVTTFVPAGATVRLVSTLTAGATATLVYATELVFR